MSKTGPEAGRQASPTDISPRVLRYFMAVTEELHFGRAATRLYISQPSLSHQIRKLEETLGTPLFVRSNRRVELTAAGRTLVKEAPTALGALERAIASVLATARRCAERNGWLRSPIT